MKFHYNSKLCKKVIHLQLNRLPDSFYYQFSYIYLKGFYVFNFVFQNLGLYNVI